MKVWLNDLVEYFNYNFIVNMLLLVSSRLQQTIANSYLYNEGFFRVINLSLNNTFQGIRTTKMLKDLLLSLFPNFRWLITKLMFEL